MTSRDALEMIVVDLVPKAKEHNKEEIEIVEKDLEVLEILKNKNIDLLALKKFNDSEAYNLYVYTYNEKAKNAKNEIIKDIDCLDNIEFVKIKEWLDDDK